MTVVECRLHHFLRLLIPKENNKKYYTYVYNSHVSRDILYQTNKNLYIYIGMFLAGFKDSKFSG